MENKMKLEISNANIMNVFIAKQHVAFYWSKSIFEDIR